ncbi:hypothetical protein HUF18_18220 [Thalassolituus sp. ST750PaO-4]|uniref:hypothetical protein n=1 Tax=Thalassolituus sp. ST750PaO-4 TaxID=2742965 RepID=UPI000C5F738E|nr:hypothetical protein [Thalassolituus sp. ST750PaO-4]MCA6061721.1 hypothetical protein [Thalassolituus sp. ST750PaO-4]PIQ41153.1 MAG: hypothetical protein COW58_02700 [Thalassolituus sp. CG17_big_fil_post_rev_8_21_14_2_50_53_8]
MNILPSSGLTGYNSSPVSPLKASGTSAPALAKKPDSLAAETVEKTARINSRDDSQRSRTQADSNPLNPAAEAAATTTATAEYLPVRDDNSESPGISTRSLVSDPQRPEIQAFLNTSASDGTSRRGRFIDIQA